jgi:hypothetical protein
MGGDPEYRRFQFSIADLLAVMTMAALLLGTSRLPSPKFYAIRSFVEIVVLVPLWDLVWVQIMLWVLEWIVI